MDLNDPQDSDPKELKALRNIEFNEFQNWIKIIMKNQLRTLLTNI